MVTTLDDPAGRPTVRDLLKGVRTRVFPVGRLDYHSAGLLLLTNDGGLALQLTHPRYGVRKTYQVKVKGEPQPNQLATLAAGVRLPDGQTNPADVHILRRRDDKAWLSITLAEGKNRQVRRMCDAVGLPVEKLIRVAYGGLKLSNLAPGKWRHLEPEEVALLYRPQATAKPAAPSRPRGHQRRPRDDDRPRGQRPDRRRPSGARHGERADPRGDRRPVRGRAERVDSRRRDERALPRERTAGPRRADAAGPARPSPRPRRGGEGPSRRLERDGRAPRTRADERRPDAPVTGRPSRGRPKGASRPRAADRQRPAGPPRGRRRR